MKKLIALVCALSLALCAVSALADATFTTVEPGKISYATSPDFPPFESRDENDNIIGIEPEIMGLIAEKLGVELEAVPMDFTSALASAQLGKTDMVVSGVTATGPKYLERSAMFDFTEVYTYIQQAVVFKQGVDVTLANLGEKTIGVQGGTTGQGYAEDDYGEDHVIAYDTYALAFQALLNGQVDCIMLDDVVGYAYLKMHPELTIIPTEYEQEGFAFGVYKQDTGLLDAINAVLKELVADGTVENIIVKWNQ